MAEQVLSHTVHPHPQPGGSLLAKLLEVLHRWTQDGDLSNEGVLQESLYWASAMDQEGCSAPNPITAKGRG